MGIDRISIPTMSDEPKGVLSGARCTTSWERVQLGAENIKRVECLKSRLRSGILEEKREIGDRRSELILFSARVAVSQTCG